MPQNLCMLFEFPIALLNFFIKNSAHRANDSCTGYTLMNCDTLQSMSENF